MAISLDKGSLSCPDGSAGRGGRKGVTEVNAVAGSCKPGERSPFGEVGMFRPSGRDFMALSSFENQA